MDNVVNINQLDLDTQFRELGNTFLDIYDSTCEAEVFITLANACFQLTGLPHETVDELKGMACQLALEFDSEAEFAELLSVRLMVYDNPTSAPVQILTVQHQEPANYPVMIPDPEMILTPLRQKAQCADYRYLTVTVAFLEALIGVGFQINAWIPTPSFNVHTLRFICLGMMVTVTYYVTRDTHTG